MFGYLVVSLLTFIMTLVSVAAGYIMAKPWLDKRLNQPKPVQKIPQQSGEA
jgi:hypothetical protein